MDRLAGQLEAAADVLTSVDRSVPALNVSAATFGAAEAGGLPGRLGRELHARWAAVLEARAREASDVAGHLTQLAASLRAIRSDYASTDDAAARRFFGTATPRAGDGLA
jgi:hypothetical protein